MLYQSMHFLRPDSSLSPAFLVFSSPSLSIYITVVFLSIFYIGNGEKKDWSIDLILFIVWDILFVLSTANHSLFLFLFLWCIFEHSEELLSVVISINRTFSHEWITMQMDRDILFDHFYCVNCVSFDRQKIFCCHHQIGRAKRLVPE